MWNGIVFVGQLGLSLIMPLIICLVLCWLAVSRTGAGSWVYIPGFILGIGAGFSTAYGFYRHVEKKNARGRGQKAGAGKEFSVSRHF